jgi:SAM-dependent methyltransferase
VLETHTQTGAIVETGVLHCSRCANAYHIVRSIPRFVPEDNYASGFGFQWGKHARTQYDSYSGIHVSEKRFFGETKWPRNLADQTILEVGCGAGRFTEQAASTEAFVVSFDYSTAVEANYQLNGHRANVLIVQADIYHMPFPRAFFDRLFCFGVLQHTPDVCRAFFALPPMLKPGGVLAMDVYKQTFERRLHTKYYIRPFTRTLDPVALYWLVKKWVDFMWPVCQLIRKIPRYGPSINIRLLVADQSRLGLQGEALKEWAYLDTFDMLSPRYDSPQRLATVRHWFGEAGLVDYEVHYGYNGIEGRGYKPVAERQNNDL